MAFLAMEAFLKRLVKYTMFENHRKSHIFNIASQVPYHTSSFKNGENGQLVIFWMVLY